MPDRPSAARSHACCVARRDGALRYHAADRACRGTGLTAVFRRFVAIGDSQTEGVGDEPHADGSDRGWADRFAHALAASSSDLLYANLAIRGRCIRPIRDEQLEPALALKPDLVSVMAGANDLIRPKLDLDLTLDLMDEMQRALTATGATVMSNTYPVAPGPGPFGRRIADRFRAYNAGLRDVANRNGVLLLDLEPVATAADHRLWAKDRLHLNAEGHTRLAAAMLSLIDEAEPAWDDELPPEPVVSNARRRVDDLEWMTRYLLPWVGRRLTGRSSGDGRVAKRPEPIPPQA